MIGGLRHIPTRLGRTKIGHNIGCRGRVMHFRLSGTAGGLLVHRDHPLPLSPTRSTVDRSMHSGCVSPLVTNFGVRTFGGSSAVVIIGIGSVCSNARADVGGIFAGVGLNASSVGGLSQVLSVGSFRGGIMTASRLAAGMARKAASMCIAMRMDSSLVLLPRGPVANELSGTHMNCFAGPLLDCDSKRRQISAGQFVAH